MLNNNITSPYTIRLVRQIEPVIIYSCVSLPDRKHTMTNAQLTPELSIVQLIAQARTAQRQSRPLEAVDLCRKIMATADLTEDQRNAAYLIWMEALDDSFQFDEALIQANGWAESARSPAGRVEALLAQSGALRRKGNLAEALRIAEEA